MHALKTEIALLHGFAFARWSQGLSCMLEKKLGYTLIEKLRAILLMKADFNFRNGLIYGSRMLDVAEQYNFMPEEVYSEQGKTEGDGLLAKVLLYDVVRQLRCSSALSSINAANYYDSIAHAIASLVFQAFEVPGRAVEAMLTTIQEMKYFLCTSYEDLRNCRGSTIDIKFQGLCQGKKQLQQDGQ